MTQGMVIKKILPILMKHPVNKAALFGSYAREEQTETSDVDLVVDLDLEHCLSIFDLYDELEKALNRKIDIITLDTLQRGNAMNTLLNNIKNDLRWFYEG
ncbi:MAG: nucleotidyltransferase domain-containing protein [Defluviitaleaceae bacterium]|nr:nucleotidyltransferase domain-containing protein [Defluviitaleaceae bacterium]